MGPYSNLQRFLGGAFGDDGRCGENVVIKDRQDINDTVRPEGLEIATAAEVFLYPAYPSGARLIRGTGTF